MKFTKMQGLGNDYLYVCADELPADAAELAVKYSDRHFGVGSDGIIWILPSATADFQMRILNADGSEAEMCGNGIRCTGKYVYERGLTEKTNLAVETLAGIRTLELRLEKDKVYQVSVDMGHATVSDALQVVGDQVTDSQVAGGTTCIPVDVGNPHAIIFCDDAEAAPVDTLGPVIEHAAEFPKGTNVEFISVRGVNELRMRVWERGSGITMACGTGACASAAAAVSQGICKSDTPITIHLDGGDLEIVVDNDYRITMTGPAEFVCDGETVC